MRTVYLIPDHLPRQNRVLIQTIPPGSPHSLVSEPSKSLIMSSSGRSRRLSPEELMQAVSSLAQYLSQSEAQFSISGGAATSILRMQYGFAQRVTDDIDLVVQPRGSMTAESISHWLLEKFPTAFVAKQQFGVTTPAITVQRRDGSVKHVEIEMFDVGAWPNRPQYNLDDPDNDVAVISVNGVDVPIFSARWLLREKIVTAFERQGTRKEETDLDDISILLETVDVNGLDLTDREDAVRHAVAQLPESFELLCLKVVCPGVLGEPWVWNEYAEVYWASKEQLQYLDTDLERHNFDWDPNRQVWYFSNEKGQTWFHDVDTGDLKLST